MEWPTRPLGRRPDPRQRPCRRGHRLADDGPAPAAGAFRNRSGRVAECKRDAGRGHLVTAAGEELRHLRQAPDTHRHTASRVRRSAGLPRRPEPLDLPGGALPPGRRLRRDLHHGDPRTPDLHPAGGDGRCRARDVGLVDRRNHRAVRHATDHRRIRVPERVHYGGAARRGGRMLRACLHPGVADPQHRPHRRGRSAPARRRPRRDARLHQSRERPRMAVRRHARAAGRRRGRGDLVGDPGVTSRRTHHRHPGPEPPDPVDSAGLGAGCGLLPEHAAADEHRRPGAARARAGLRVGTRRGGRSAAFHAQSRDRDRRNLRRVDRGPGRPGSAAPRRHRHRDSRDLRDARRRLSAPAGDRVRRHGRHRRRRDRSLRLQPGDHAHTARAPGHDRRAGVGRHGPRLGRLHLRRRRSPQGHPGRPAPR